MRKGDAIEDLSRIKRISLAILLIAVTVIVGGAIIVGAIIIGISGYINWRFYRCPHCGSRLNTEMHLDERTYCPRCGEVISKEKE